MRGLVFTAIAIGLTASATAQDAEAVPTQEAIQAQPSRPPASYKLPANTEILLKTTQEVTTKGKTWSEGDSFKLSVAHDVMLGDYVVIPADTPAVGKITWLTSRGAFGKSGKMDIELEYIQLNGRRVDIDGTYRQEGEGNTLATVGGVIAAGVFAGFITGKSGRIPKGRELMATLERDLPVNLPAGASVTPAAVAAQPVEAAPMEPPPVTPADTAPDAAPEDDE